MAIRSIRWRIQIWYALLLSLIVSTLLVLHHQHERKILYQDLDRQLKEPVPPLRSFLRSKGVADAEETRFQRRGPRGQRRFRGTAVLDRLNKEGVYFASWSQDGEALHQSENYPSDGSPPSEISNHPGASYRTVGKYRELLQLARSRNLLIVGKDTSRLEAELRILAWKLAGLGIALVGVGLVVGYFLVGRSLRPIRKISETASGLIEGKAFEPIQQKDTDSELGQLAGVLNETFSQLQSSYEQQVRFTADASHEIRTPIAVILAEGSFALSRERSPERYREALQICVDSAEHMSTLTESLLELARLDSGQLKVKRKVGDLKESIEQALQLVMPLAQSRNIKLTADLDEITASFDAARLNQVLINLLSNAIKYNREDGRVEITLKEHKGFLKITISDSGPGISPEKLPHIFDRFYRADESHSESNKGSTGLGLAITKAIVEAHGGRITVESVIDKGSTFTIKL